MNRYERPLDPDWWRSALDDTEQTASVIQNASRWDRQDYAQMCKELKKLTAAQRKLAGFAETGEPLMEDAFLSLLKVEPELRAPEGVQPDHLINRKIVDELTGMSAYQELHNYTAGDEVAAAFACVTLEPTLEELLDREKTRQKEADALQQKLQELRDAMAAKQDLDELFERWTNQQSDSEDSDSGEDSGEGFPQQAEMDAAGQQVADLEAEVEALAAALQAGMESDGPAIQAALAQGLSDAAAEAEGFSRCDSWGSEPGQLTRLPADKRIEMAKRVNTPRMKRIADMFGAMKNLMWAEQAKKTKRAHHSVVDIELGNDLSRMLPSELLRLDDPLQEDHFYADYVSESLLQYRLEGEEKLGKGGLIVCEDGSYSMHGERELWSKAVSLCLLNLAKQQRREFHMVHFGSESEIWEKKFKQPADWSLNNILDVAEIFWGGGTNFNSPIKAAVKALREEFTRTGQTTGDIIMITDGYCAVSPAFMEWFRKEQAELKFDFYGICIGGETRAEPLYTLADGKVANVESLMSGGDIREVFRAI